MAVLDHWWFERPMLAHLRHAVPGFDAHGVDRFTHLARYPAETPRFPEYRRAEVWDSGRFIISRWVLETSTLP
jgi:hypothetical protein